MKNRREISKKLTYFLIVSLILIILALSVFYFSFTGKIVSDTGNVYYLSPNGNDANSGTISQPWNSIERAFNSSYSTYVHGGDTLYLRGGNYRFSSLKLNAVLSNRDISGSSLGYTTVSSYPGERAKIYLSKNVSGWTSYSGRSGTGIYLIDWRNYLQSIGYLPNYDFFSRPQGVFVDSNNPIVLQQVNALKTSLSDKAGNSFNTAYSIRTNMTDMQEGDFYYETNSSNQYYGKLFVWLANGQNPNNVQVEIPIEYSLSFNTNYTLIRNISVMYGNDPWSGLLIFGNNNIIEGLEGKYNTFSGLDGRCYNCTVRDSVFTSNGNTGSNLRGDGTSYTGNTFDGNNYRDFDGAFHCGGMKIIDGDGSFSEGYRRINNMSFVNNIFKNTLDCPGLWFDWMGHGLIVEGNYFINNSNGLTFEVTNGTSSNPNIVRNNIFIGNDERAGNPRDSGDWYPALGISSSQYTYVYNNLFYKGRSGIMAATFPGEVQRNYLTNNKIKNNIFLNITNPILLVSDNSGFRFGNEISNNIYYGSYGNLPYNETGAAPFKQSSSETIFCLGFGHCYNDFSRWVSEKNELNSLFVNPLLTVFDNNSISISENSPVRDFGLNLSEISKDFNGLSRPQGASFDVGPIELKAFCIESDWGFSISPSICPVSEKQVRTWTKLNMCENGVSKPLSENVSCTFIPSCGDNICQVNESCSICSHDCGVCSTTTGSSSSSSVSGSSGSGSDGSSSSGSSSGISTTGNSNQDNIDNGQDGVVSLLSTHDWKKNLTLEQVKNVILGTIGFLVIACIILVVFYLRRT